MLCRVLFLTRLDSSCLRPPGEIREVFLSFKNAISTNKIKGFVNDFYHIMKEERRRVFSLERKDSEFERKQELGSEKQSRRLRSSLILLILLELCQNFDSSVLSFFFSFLHFSCFGSLEECFRKVETGDFNKKIVLRTES